MVVTAEAAAADDGGVVVTAEADAVKAEVRFGVSGLNEASISACMVIAKLNAFKTSSADRSSSSPS